MEINPTNKNIACEIMCCKNKANYVVKSDKSIFNNQLFICDSCLKELHNLFSKFTTPKSIKNIYKKGEQSGKK